MKVIHKEFFERMKFDHTNKWFMQKPDFILENEMHKIPWGFEIKTDNLIPIRRPDLELIQKKSWTCRIENFAVPVDHRKIKESEKIDEYFDLAKKKKN